MPNRSKEDTEITIQKIMDAVVDQLIQFGYDKMSYTSLSRQTGISRTGISHHFPKKTDFASSLDDRIFNTLVSHLDFSDSVDTFVISWKNALTNVEFIALIRLVFHHIVSSDRGYHFGKSTLDRMFDTATQHFGDASHERLKYLMGESILAMGV
ncbi:MAG: TetR family transcriptional regulator [Vibrio sp.]